VADALGAPLDLVIIREVGAQGNPELDHTRRDRPPHGSQGCCSSPRIREDIPRRRGAALSRRGGRPDHIPLIGISSSSTVAFWVSSRDA
jgi:hypothetical protein